jgi:tRNA(fMet)-specific endonuclease VapC
MKYLLDTNICIYIIKNRPAEVLERFNHHRVGDIGISAITYCELEYGAAHSAQPDRNRAALEKFSSPLEVMEYRPEIAPLYGRIRAQLARGGKMIGPLDMLIAAHAAWLGWTLVTNNVREYGRVPDLNVENWVRPRS